jgi:hypothetical protein
VRKQSPNGKAERQRVGSGAHLSEGEENDEGEKYLQPSPHVIGEGEREGQSGSPKSALCTSVEPDR